MSPCHSETPWWSAYRPVSHRGRTYGGCRLVSGQECDVSPTTLKVLMRRSGSLGGSTVVRHRGSTARGRPTRGQSSSTLSPVPLLDRSSGFQHPSVRPGSSWAVKGFGLRHLLLAPPRKPTPVGVDTRGSGALHPCPAPPSVLVPEGGPTEVPTRSGGSDQVHPGSWRRRPPRSSVVPESRPGDLSCPSRPKSLRCPAPANPRRSLYPSRTLRGQ